MSMQTNIDDVRDEIMRLESAPHFNADAWSRVLADLSTAGRFSALADAQRRMETARSNQPAVAVETDYNVDGKLKAYWVQVQYDEWGMWIHAESVGKAKSIYHQQDPSLEPANFTELRVIRPDRDLPDRDADLLDFKPFTDYALELAGYPRTTDEIVEFPDAFLEFCPCSMCKAERLKPTYRMSINDLVEA